MVDAVADWQDLYLAVLGRRLVFAADEYYLLAEPALPARGPLRRLRHARGRHRHGPGLRGRAARGRRGPHARRRSRPGRLLPQRRRRAGGHGHRHRRRPVGSVARRTSPVAASPVRTPTRGAGAPTRTNRAPGAHERGATAGCGVVGVGGAADVSGSTDADYEPYRAVRATADQLVQHRPQPPRPGRHPRPPPTGPGCSGRSSPPRPAGRAHRDRRQPLLRRQRGRLRPDGGRRPRPGARRPARGPPLPAARRVPHPGAVPRRHRPRRPAPPGRGRAHRRPRPARRPGPRGPATGGDLVAASAGSAAPSGSMQYPEIRS